ncbi:hypothetical protein [Oceaniradius stylonematis]|uniref:hypothetical protein n=1 Tax=Oceaniradius stylonematis TaxID=2184161 RepID=UPI00273F999A|nr:hypothetical protein [Oceaniradius stylonematis]
MRPARTDTFDHTISGLLTKRADLWNEAQSIRDRLAEIKNDIDALDRTLGVLGYDGDLDAAMPRQKRHVVFGRGELFRACMDVLRQADGPMTSRQIAQEIVSQSGQDARDRRYVSDLTKRVGKCLRASDAARKATDGKGNVVWSV